MHNPNISQHIPTYPNISQHIPTIHPKWYPHDIPINGARLSKLPWRWKMTHPMMFRSPWPDWTRPPVGPSSWAETISPRCAGKRSLELLPDRRADLGHTAHTAHTAAPWSAKHAWWNKPRYFFKLIRKNHEKTRKVAKKLLSHTKPIQSQDFFETHLSVLRQ